MEIKKKKGGGGVLFVFNIGIKNSELMVNIGSSISFDSKFHKNIAEMVYYYSVFKRTITKIVISCEQLPKDDICNSFLHSILCYFDSDTHVPIYASGELFGELQNVKRSRGKEYNKVFGLCIADRKQYYCFSNDDDVRTATEELVDIIVGTSLVIDRVLLKQFMMDTIVELYSNCVLHSTKKECELIYSISKVDNDFFFDVNVTDYGKTIYDNVVEYFKSKNLAAPKNCVEWAMGARHTTRKNSTGGYGLTTLYEYISKICGSLIILSGPEMLSLKNEKIEVEKLNYSFSGTSISFRIKLFDFSRITVFNGCRVESFSLKELIGGYDENKNL